MRLSLPPGPSSARRLPAPRAPRRGRRRSRLLRPAPRPIDDLAVEAEINRAYFVLRLDLLVLRHVRHQRAEALEEVAVPQGDLGHVVDQQDAKVRPVREVDLRDGAAESRRAAFELREHLASHPHARRVLLLVQPVAFGLLPQESPEDGRVELAVLRVVAVQQDSLVVGNEEPVVHLQDHRRNPLPDVQDQVGGKDAADFGSLDPGLGLGESLQLAEVDHQDVRRRRGTDAPLQLRRIEPLAPDEPDGAHPELLGRVGVVEDLEQERAESEEEDQLAETAHERGDAPGALAHLLGGLAAQVPARVWSPLRVRSLALSGRFCDPDLHGPSPLLRARKPCRRGSPRRPSRRPRLPA